MADKLDRLARNGRADLIAPALAFLAGQPRPVFTARHRVWTFAKLAEDAQSRIGERAGQSRKLIGEAGGVEMWADYQIDRVQLVFAEKPGQELRQKLRGWNWSPRNQAWQRQLTQNGIASGKAILAGLTPEREGEGREIA